MPRSSRHKLSKHSSREYSDSEKDSSSLKERKNKEESGSVRVSEEYGSGEKRKLDSKDSGNGEYMDEYSSSSKRRKERGGARDGGSDRRGEEDVRGREAVKRVKEKTGEQKSRRREDSVEKNGGRSDGRHKDSGSRKEGREREREREGDKENERKGKKWKDDRAADGDDSCAFKQSSEKAELNANLLRNPEFDNRSDRHFRKKRDGSGDGNKYHEDVAKDVRPKDEKPKDGRHRDKRHVDVHKENRHQDDKESDDLASRDPIKVRSDVKLSKDGKDTTEYLKKKSKPQENDWDHNNDQDFDLGRDRIRDHHRNRDHDRDRNSYQDRDHGHNRDLDWDRDQDRDRDHNRDRDRKRDCNMDRDGDRDRDSDRNIDYDVIDDRSARYKDSRGKKRSADGCDEYNDAKSRGIKSSHLDMEADADGVRSQSQQSHLVRNIRGNRWGTSPDTDSNGAGEEYRHLKQYELYEDAVVEQMPKAISSRQAGKSERISKYRSSDKLIKVDDGHGEESTLEMSSGSKASHVGLRDRSPPSSFGRRYRSRSVSRRSLEVEESGRRSSGSIGAKDKHSVEDRQGWEDKSPPDESTLGDPNYHNRSNSSNSGFIPPLGFRGRVNSPSFTGSLEDDHRVSAGARNKRGGDPSLGRGQGGNAWRGGPPNWSSPLPNGYIPFQHGPAHGSFQGMMPHFPSPPLFAVRPSMEINHARIPYHIPDADRFSGRLHPMPWQNIIDGSGPSHLHGWDGNNGVFRDEARMYRNLEWDQTRHPMTNTGWETSNSDIWKGQNGDGKRELPLASTKEDFHAQTPVDSTSPLLSGQQSENNYLFPEENVETEKAVASYKLSPKTLHEKLPGPSKMSNDDNVGHICWTYLSKLDISAKLAAPELYSQCMSLLGMEQSIDEGSAILMDLKDGARAVSKHSNMLLSSLLFPMANDLVFQRAMGIYKQQKIGSREMVAVNGRMVDVISKSKVQEVTSYVEQTQEAPTLNLDKKKEETSDDVVKKSEEMVSTLSLEVVGVNGHTPDPALPGQSPARDFPEKPGQVCDMMDRELPELVSSEDARLNDCNVNEVVSSLDSDGHNLVETGKVKEENTQCPEEGQGLNDGLCDPLDISDGSTKASGALVPGSNESKSVILTRIHHSPENTH